MIRLPPFTLLTPRTVTDAARMLADHGPAAAAVAGGTGLYPSMKRRQVQPRVLVSLRAVDGLRGVDGRPGEEVRVGALTILADLARSGTVPPALSGAAGAVASPQIRNMATVGGNLCLDTRCNYYDMSQEWRGAVGFCLKAGGDSCRVAPSGDRCWAVSASDIAPVAVALSASVRLVGPRGERVVQAADLYRNDGIDYLRSGPAEILTELLIPPRLRGLRVTYRKVRQRGTIDFGLLGVAAAIRLAPDGTCLAATIVLGSVAAAPLRCQRAEGLLLGHRLTADVIEQAATAAAGPARPLDNADLPHYYRKWIIPVHVARVLEELAGRPAADPGRPAADRAGGTALSRRDSARASWK